MTKERKRTRFGRRRRLITTLVEKESENWGIWTFFWSYLFLVFLRHLSFSESSDYSGELHRLELRYAGELQQHRRHRGGDRRIVLLHANHVWKRESCGAFGTGSKRRVDWRKTAKFWRVSVWETDRERRTCIRSLERRNLWRQGKNCTIQASEITVARKNVLFVSHALIFSPVAGWFFISCFHVRCLHLRLPFFHVVLFSFSPLFHQLVCRRQCAGKQRRISEPRAERKRRPRSRAQRQALMKNTERQQRARFVRVCERIKQNMTWEHSHGARRLLSMLSVSLDERKKKEDIEEGKKGREKELRRARKTKKKLASNNCRFLWFSSTKQTDMRISSVLLLCAVFSLLVAFADAQYQPNWASLNSRPLPQ